MTTPTNPGPLLDPEYRPPEPLPQLPIAIVVADPEQAMAYLDSAPLPSPYVVVRTVSDIGGRSFGGLALLTTERLPQELLDALTAALLRQQAAQ